MDPIPRTLQLPGATLRRVADAEAALGRLAGVGGTLPNPHLLIRPYVLREAVASTRIEGTRTTIAEVFGADAAEPNPDVEEVLNYIEAVEWGVTRLDTLPLGTRLVRELHERVMAGTRGRNRMPGEVRTTQNWIGAPGSTLDTATFIPPPPQDLATLLTDWERFANETPEMPLLVQDALLHSQFEAIHPFLDGNGRLGRLLLVFFLIARGRLPGPLLYLSAYLERHRDEYYATLAAAQDGGDPLPWIELFLAAVETQALDAVRRAQALGTIREQYMAAAATMATANGMSLVELICENPVVTTRQVEQRLGVSRPTALRLLRQLEERRVLSKGEPGARGQRRYVAPELMRVVTEDSGE